MTELLSSDGEVVIGTASEAPTLNKYQIEQGMALEEVIKLQNKVNQKHERAEAAYKAKIQAKVNKAKESATKYGPSEDARTRILQKRAKSVAINEDYMKCKKPYAWNLALDTIPEDPAAQSDQNVDRYVFVQADTNDFKNKVTNLVQKRKSVSFEISRESNNAQNGSMTRSANSGKFEI